jgi:hypothetical protein
MYGAYQVALWGIVGICGDSCGGVREGIVPLLLSRDSQTNSASNTNYDTISKQ